MQKPPRPRHQPLIDNGLLVRSFLWLGMIETALCYAGFIAVYLFSGYTAELGLSFLANLPFPDFLKLNITKEATEIMAVTVFHAGVVMSQVGNAFACRSESTRSKDLGWISNKYILIAVLSEILGIIILIYWAPLAQKFEHVPLPAVYWVGLLGFSLSIYSIEWIRKQITRAAKIRVKSEPQS